jgi:hypothetical protein
MRTWGPGQSGQKSAAACPALKVGLELLRGLDHPFARAAFVHFLIA